MMLPASARRQSAILNDLRGPLQVLMKLFSIRALEVVVYRTAMGVTGL